MRTITCDFEALQHLMTDAGVVYATTAHYVAVAEGEEARTEELVTHAADLEDGYLFVIQPPVAEETFVGHFKKSVRVAAIQ